MAAAAAAHIDALAKAAKHAGHPDRIDHIRADLFLGLTDGSYTGLDDAAIVAALLATARIDAADQSRDDQGPDGQGPDDGSSQARGSGQAGGIGRVGARSGRVEVRVRLSTLLGLDDCPGELTGWGPVHAELARQLAHIHTGAEWRFAVTDSEGKLRHAGITRHRPTGWARTRSAGIVELQVPAATLTSLADAPDQLGEWTSVVADLRRQAADQHNDAARFVGDAGRRLPGVALSRYVQIRDRRCRFRPA